jgi:Tfp pilus assembly protein PilV
MKPNTTTRFRKITARRTSDGQQGFTLIETSIAFVVMMVVGLGAASLFFYSMGLNSTARDRELSMAVAQQEIELLRNAQFADLDAAVTAGGGANKTVTSASRQYTVVTTIADTVAGDSTQKTITVEVTPRGTNVSGLTAVQRVFGGVRLVTQRATKLLGPNRGI